MIGFDCLVYFVILFMFVSTMIGVSTLASTLTLMVASTLGYVEIQVSKWWKMVVPDVRSVFNMYLRCFEVFWSSFCLFHG